MGRSKRRVEFQGRTVDATPISANQSNEYWNNYLLEDGTVVRMKVVATEFLRLDGEYDQEGNPVYMIKSTTIVASEAPDELKRH